MNTAESQPLGLVPAMERTLSTSRTEATTNLESLAKELPRSSARKELDGLLEDVRRGKSAKELVIVHRELAWVVCLRSTPVIARTATALFRKSINRSRLQRRRFQAIAYPMFVFAFGLTVLLIASATLLQQFDEMFQEFELRLPAPTLLLMLVSRTVREHPFEVAAGCVAGFALVYFLLDGFLLRRSWTGKLRHAFIGTNHVSRSTIADVTLKIGCLLEDGYSIQSAVAITAETTRDEILADEIRLAATGERGTTTCLPANLRMALRPPTNVPLLRELSEIYQDVQLQSGQFFAFLFSQLCLVGVGLLIAFIVISLFLPLLSLVTSLS
ncbi:MAG: hypothetical protein AAF802_16780 [Planctomycetota bacterium]